jgi:hypothetical protein
LKAGDKLTGLAITITDDAASLRGRVAPENDGSRLPGKMIVHLTPAEPSSANELLRYAEAVTERNGAFEFKNIAPGKYRLLARPMPDNVQSDGYIPPIAWDATERAKLRKEAEAMKIEIELKPCQRAANQIVKFK